MEVPFVPPQRRYDSAEENVFIKIQIYSPPFWLIHTQGEEGAPMHLLARFPPPQSRSSFFHWIHIAAIRHKHFPCMYFWEKEDISPHI